MSYLWLIAVFSTRKIRLGTADATLKYDVNSACRGVLFVEAFTTELFMLVFLNLYIQY